MYASLARKKRTFRELPYYYPQQNETWFCCFGVGGHLHFWSLDNIDVKVLPKETGVTFGALKEKPAEEEMSELYLWKPPQEPQEVVEVPEGGVVSADQ
eukprot:5096314-Amphidinium_carterae.1